MAFPQHQVPVPSAWQRLTETVKSRGALLMSPSAEDFFKGCCTVIVVGRTRAGNLMTTWLRDAWKGQQYPGEMSS